MSKPIDDGGPACPVPEGTLPGFEGLTLRDWFAGHVMSGFAVCHDESDRREWQWQALAEAAYMAADAMLAERSRDRE